MTNLIAGIFTMIVTNWTEIPTVGSFGVLANNIISIDPERPPQILRGYAQTNTMAKLVWGNKTNDVLLAEGEPFLEIWREIKPTTIVTYSTNETVKPYIHQAFQNVTNQYVTAVWTNKSL